MLQENGQPAQGAKPESYWLARTVDSEPPFSEKSDTRLEAASSRVFDYAADISRKGKPGHYILRVSVHWWAVAPKRAEAMGLKEADTHIEVLEQRIPFSVF